MEQKRKYNRPETRAQRFSNSRIEHNQHGKQTMDAVAEATGVTKSVIHALEYDMDANAKERNVGFRTVAILANHYGVSADYLLGLSEDHTRKSSVVDELGLSVEAVEKLHEWQNDHQEYIAILNRLLTSTHFEDFLSHAYHYDLVSNAASSEEYDTIRGIVEKNQFDAMDYLGEASASPLITAFVALKSNLDHKDIANFYLHEAQDTISYAVTHLRDTQK